MSLRRLLAAIWLLAALLTATKAQAERYWLQRRDGETQTGERLRLSDTRYAPALDDQRLIDVNNPVRVLRDTTITVQPATHFIDLANGDRLIGRVQSMVIGEAAFPWPDHVVVGETRYSRQVRVRLDWIRRIVAGGQPQGEIPPGQIRLADGRRLQPRSLRFTSSGVRALTDEGIVNISTGEIAELHLALAPILAPLPGATMLDGEAPKITRTVMASGEALTHPHSMVARVTFDDRRRIRKESLSLLATRPPWALDTLYFNPEEIAWQTYLDDDEVPLSLLPVVGEDRSAAVHHLPWRRNRNAHGGVLQCGDAVSELGVGMHSRSRLTFALPPKAKTFTSQVGIDRAAGEGGCVHCRIFRDDDPRPIWERNYLRGGDGVLSIGPINIDGAKTLSLEVDFADDGRPSGADPLDIRDWVNWLAPMVTIDAQSARTEKHVQLLVPEIEGWSLSDDMLRQLTLRPSWHEKESVWRMALCTGEQPLVLSRYVRVDLTNAWLRIEAAAADMPGILHEIRVAANVENVGSTMNGRMRTMDKGRFHDRIHTLNRQAGRDVELIVAAEPIDMSRRAIKGVVFKPLQLQPLVLGLPDDGRPIQSDVPLTSLKPIRATCNGRPLELVPGMISDRKALNVRGWEFDEGYGAPTGSEITYEYDPAWRRFVAIIGLADGWKGAGPYQVLVDDAVVWSSQQDYARNDPGEQIVVDLPGEGTTVTLRMLGEESGGAWAHAGFLLE